MSSRRLVLPPRIIPLLILLLLLNCPAATAGPNELLRILEQRVSNGSFGRIDSLLIWHDGNLLVEGYYRGYDADRLHPTYSMTKSFTSALVGIAIENGAIGGTGSKMLDYFPNYTPANLDARKEAITIDHLLKMQAGFIWDESSIPYTSPGNSVYELEHTDRDWMEYVLDQEMLTMPGESFAYNTGVSMLLSRVISESVGTTTRAFAEETLFADLGIDNFDWSETPQGEVHTGGGGGGGLWLRPLDMLKFGQLYLNNGFWQPEDGSLGKQVVPSEWVAASTQPYVEEWMLGYEEIAPNNYGYQWWLARDDAPSVSKLAVNDLYVGVGYAGQVLVVVPHLDLVVVITSDHPGNNGRIFKLFPRYIYPAIQQLAVPEPSSTGLALFAVVGTFCIGCQRRGVWS